MTPAVYFSEELEQDKIKSTMIKFKTTILRSGNNTGIEVPENVLEELGSGKRPLVVVTLNNYVYRSAVAKMGDKFLISLSAENRKNANVKGGEELEIKLELDKAPRTVEVPTELQKALDKHETAKANFEKLAASKKKALVLSINEAKTDDTRSRRIEKAVQSLL
ncbi:MAG: Phosphate transport regulator (distant homolog of PhoU) [uncultured Segetibacter sp.]|uniref:Phosphate transport regulator (Distant homolog of PhoU) n=1 Tax=uncultured Segetibacter sp. TaxID=481133 RepID=A0A6J4TQN4_9BACT|nr:MAG: Phosphate transport regulator (distant homolog of PhoU) [uncultured Segetibacter sp.]